MIFQSQINFRVYSWSQTQAQMGNGVQLGFSIDLTLRKDT